MTTSGYLYHKKGIETWTLQNMNEKMSPNSLKMLEKYNVDAVRKIWSYSKINKTNIPEMYFNDSFYSYLNRVSTRDGIFAQILFQKYSGQIDKMTNQYKYPKNKKFVCLECFVNSESWRPLVDLAFRSPSREKTWIMGNISLYYNGLQNKDHRTSTSLRDIIIAKHLDAHFFNNEYSELPWNELCLENSPTCF